MLRIEKNSQGGTTTIRLIGHFEAEHLGELKNQLEDNGPEFVLDLKEVTIVDVEVVRFLGAREAEGVKIVHCPQYIRGWMARERKVNSGGPGGYSDYPAYQPSRSTRS